jgi:hypothetical protein
MVRILVARRLAEFIAGCASSPSLHNEDSTPALQRLVSPATAAQFLEAATLLMERHKGCPRMTFGCLATPAEVRCLNDGLCFADSGMRRAGKLLAFAVA